MVRSGALFVPRLESLPPGATKYSVADEAPAYAKTVRQTMNGIFNAFPEGLNVSIRTPIICAGLALGRLRLFWEMLAQFCSWQRHLLISPFDLRCPAPRHVNVHGLTKSKYS